MGASRVEDLRMLGEMQASLEAGSLAPALVRRLGVECELREEWRTTRALDALAALAALRAEAGEGVAHALFERCGARMQADAALMLDGLPKRAQPWQHALVAQTRAVADAVVRDASAAQPASAAECIGDSVSSWPLGALRAQAIDTPSAQLSHALALLSAAVRALLDSSVGAAAAARTPLAAARRRGNGLAVSASAGAAGVLCAPHTPDRAAPPDASGVSGVRAARPSAPDLDAFVQARIRELRDARRDAAARIVQRAARCLLARRALARARVTLSLIHI